MGVEVLGVEGLDQVFICPSCGAEIWLDQGIE